MQENSAIVLPSRFEPRSFAFMERMPWYVVYALHVPYCLYLAARHGGMATPTMSNPGLEASGLAGESKTGLFNLLGPTGRAHLPAYVSVKAGITDLAEIRRAMTASGIAFPVVVKPDIGRRGFGVKKIASDAELSEHIAKFRRGTLLLVQRYAPGPHEAGLFYLRKPSEPRGRILSFTIKHFPQVTGNGVSTVRELILRDPRARAFAKLYFRRNRKYLDQVLALGEKHTIVSLGNHVRGAAFEDATPQLTPELEQVFDTIAREIPGGYYVGRFDVRYRNLETFRRGQDFDIVEYNGASGEPTHIWDPRKRASEVYAGLMAHCRYLFETGAENRARGARPTPVREIVGRHFSEWNLLKTYPDEE